MAFMDMFGFMFGFGIFSFFLMVAAALFWLWMFVDLLQRRTEDKLVWAIVLIFLNVVGAILYYFLVYSKKTKKR